MNRREVKRAPVLRFKGFTNDWEQRKLGYEVNFYSGLTYHPDDIRNSGVFVIRSSNIKNNRLISADNVFVNPQIVNSKPVHINDIVVVVRNGSRKLIGKHVLIQHELHDTVIGAFMTGIRSSNNFFINATLDSQLFKKEIQKNLGSTINQITVKNFQNMVFGFPSKIEKDKIGKLFRIIDNIISLQQRKLERLKSLKKAYLRLIFNTSESIHYLKDIAEYRRGSFPQPYTKREWYGGKDSQPFVQVADVNTNLRLFSKTKETISKKAQQNSVFVPKDTIVVTLQGSIGRVAITQYDSYVDRTLLIITKLKKRIDKYYLAYALQEKFNIEKRKAPGGTIKTITKSTLSNFAIILPNFEKQSQQSQTLKTIDNEIYLINKKLDKLVQFKQFLLQNMFI